MDEDFKKIFKIKADFDSVMNRTRIPSSSTPPSARSARRKPALRPTGVAAVIEHGCGWRPAEEAFHRIPPDHGCPPEANYWAKKDGSGR
jgi:hypothetical protein